MTMGRQTSLTMTSAAAGTMAAFSCALAAFRNNVKEPRSIVTNVIHSRELPSITSGVDLNALVWC